MQSSPLVRQVVVQGESFRVLTAGDGPPLLLVHGFPLDHSMWSGQISALAERCTVIAPDLRGFGGSLVTPGVVTMEQLADDLANLLAALAVQGPVTFCGLSMGGYVAWRFWERHRARLARLILCDTRAAADTPATAEGRLAAAERALREGPGFLVEAMFPRLFAAANQTSPYAEQVRQVMRAAPPEGIAAALRGMARRPDVTAWLPQLELPVLVLCGEHDLISPASEMETIAAAIPGARFVCLAGAGHMAPGEAPAAFNRALLDFLS